MLKALAGGVLRSIARAVLSPSSVPVVAAEVALRLVTFLRARLAPNLPPEVDSTPHAQPGRIAELVPEQSVPHPRPEEEEVLQAMQAVGARLDELLTYGAPAVVSVVPRSANARENKYDELIARAHSRFPVVPADIIKGVIATESSFRPEVWRDEPQIHDRSRGLMQLLLKTARGLGFRESPDLLYDPELNVMLGTALLAQLYRRFGDWTDALAAYNGGYPRRSTTTGQLEPRLAQYVAKVMGHIARWKKAPAVSAAQKTAGVASLVALAVLLRAFLRRGGV